MLCCSCGDANLNLVAKPIQTKAGVATAGAVV